MRSNQQEITLRDDGETVILKQNSKDIGYQICVGGDVSASPPSFLYSCTIN